MWVFTKLGFISVVKHAQKKGWLLVRARRRDHLQAILKSAGISLMIKETPDADYRFRVELGNLSTSQDETDRMVEQNTRNR